MRYSQTFPKTLRLAPKDAESINHKLLVRAGFIDQLMAGSYTLLPLGWKVYTKIENIIREELNKVGCQEMLMPLLHPREIWDATGRWSNKDVQEIMYQFSDIHKKEFGLSFTHEEIVAHTLSKFIHSYKDLPVFLYHFSTKFRNELRAKSGILRGREFIMKDLYSAHATEDDMWSGYEKIKEAYLKAFERIGLNIRVVEAAGGVFTKNHTHEFQAFAQSGEDTIYYCEKCDFSQNKEIYENKNNKCPKCQNEIKVTKSIEVGNIFPFGQKYTTELGVTFKDQSGKDQIPYFASYGIGMTRVLGTLVEVFHDEKGIIWPASVAPFNVHLIELGKDGSEVYEKLQKAGIEVLCDDRKVSAGEKFADSDLIGIPVRLVISDKTGNQVEWKFRNQNSTELLDFDQVLKKFRS